MTHVEGTIEKPGIRIGGPGVSVAVLGGFFLECLRLSNFWAGGKSDLKVRTCFPGAACKSIDMISGSLFSKKKAKRYLCDRVLTQENADMVFVGGDNSVQDVTPCVIENRCVACELCATQHGTIGTASVVETDLVYYSASGES